MIVLNRIDSRLVHGQVVEAWLPHLKVKRLVVADDEAADDPLARTVMGLAVPPEVAVVLARVGAIDFGLLANDSVPTLVLFRDLAAVVTARGHGLPDGVLNLGNMHCGPGKTALSRSVFLSDDEKATLAELKQGGMEVMLQAVPSERATPLANQRGPDPHSGRASVSSR